VTTDTALSELRSHPILFLAFIVSDELCIGRTPKRPLILQSPSRVLILGVAYKKDIDDLRESPSLTIIELLQKEGAQVSYNDPYFPAIGRGRKYDLQMKCASLDDLGKYDCVVIVTDHSDYNYRHIVREAQLVVDSRNATRGIDSPKIVRC
jgi:UDP-N-acetyl-D-glucosamine dehydrogenase